MSTIFVGGAMRTGTTVLQSVLCSGPETNPVINEAHFFSHLMDVYRYGLVNFDAQLDHYFDDLQGFANFFGKFAQEFIDQTRMRYAPAKSVVLKSPEMTLMFPLVAGLFPDAKFVVSVRDPRDTIASVLEAAERQRGRGISSAITEFGRDMSALCNHYKGFYGPVFNNTDEAFMKRVHAVRYEDLLTDPESVTIELRRFTALPLRDYDPSSNWSRNLVDFQGQENQKDPFASKLRGKPLSAASVGRYKNDLTPEECAIIEQECHPIMAHFGYL